ncbi:MAG: tRNA-dihydrouridine synthase family protein [Chitinispirillales bacterium]|jgi:tRNA-dihydrouridine synthase|nr:tRNA-dihydrouridine synthase family protein [Chitinispirillales bacterium]
MLKLPTSNQPQHNFYLAPLRGITDRVFRAAFEKHFVRLDYMLAPFIPTIRGDRVKEHHIKDILPDNSSNDPLRLIPQIIGNDSDGFLLLSRRFADLGFASVNWNLGCPAPLITKKKRGSGLLPHKDIIKKFLDDTVPKLSIPLSIKTRLGLNSKDDLEALVPIFNNYPLKELIIHPRTGSQLYDGTVDVDKFEICMKMSTHSIVYNGDIRTVDDFNYLAKRFPNVNNWMIGRGLIRNLNLIGEIKKEPVQPIQKFLDDLLDAHLNRSAVLGRMKEIWRYLGDGLDETGALTEKIMRCKTIDEYKNLLKSFLGNGGKSPVCQR